MTDLAKLLDDTGIQNAVIIDDVFDDMPLGGIDPEDWAIFLDDLTPEDERKISDLYPDFGKATPSDLRKSQTFINVLWENQNELSSETVNTLIQGHESSNEIEKGQLRDLVGILENAGLTCTTIGRKFNGEVDGADLIVIDLFLGPQSSDDVIKLAVEQLREVVSRRASSPPLVILISSNPQLNERRNDFRDEAGLLSSTFRVVRKSDLTKGGSLKSILHKLASNYEDTKRVAGFLSAWNNGLECKRRTFLKRLRRLDLSDLSQIRTLLPDSEGERLGDYLLDVADRVLQHEVEGDRGTIQAALELNKIDLSKHPAPHLVGTTDLQDLVYRMIFMHDDRLKLSEENDIPLLRFGDVLRWKGIGEKPHGDKVCLVVNPACDLVHNKAESVMLLSGQLGELRAEDWSYKGDSVRTSIIILPGEERKWIEWDLRDLHALRQDRIVKLIRRGALTRIARLREVYSIAIRQKLLAQMGRIGQPANLPVPFPVAVSLFYVDNDTNARELPLNNIGFVACYVGRDEDSPSSLVFTEQNCDRIDQALQGLVEGNVGQAARASLKAVKKDPEFIMKFGLGLKIPPPKKKKKLIKGKNNEIYAVIVRDDKLKDGEPIRDGDIRKSAVIVNVTSVPNESDM